MLNEAVNRESVLIAIIAAAGDDGLDRAQLQKSAFLLREEFEARLPSDFYQFRPYMYGPFAQQIYTDVERLSDGPMIETLAGNDGRPLYRLTCDSASWQFDLPDDLESGVKRIVRWVSTMSFDELLCERSIICFLSSARIASSDIQRSWLKRRALRVASATWRQVERGRSMS